MGSPENEMVTTANGDAKITILMRTELKRSGLLGGNKANESPVCVQERGCVIDLLRKLTITIIKEIIYR